LYDISRIYFKVLGEGRVNLGEMCNVYFIITSMHGFGLNVAEV